MKKFNMVSESTGRKFKYQEEQLCTKKEKKKCVAKSVTARFHFRGIIEEWAPPEGEY